MMLGATIRHWFSDRIRTKPEDIFTVSLMPCVAKKDESRRMQMEGDVDAVLTAREYGNLIKEFGLDWASLDPNGKYDRLMGECSGGAAIFGVTGGVTQAAVRYAIKV
jgi:iron only hydrogenase large subunit-like protein